MTDEAVTDKIEQVEFSETTWPIQFSELAGMHKQIPGETPLEFLARINDPTKWLYGSELRDEMMLKTQSMIPRFANLSRKAFMHYGGDRYNPNEISFEDELYMRCTIGNFIAHKISSRVKYDWDLIDNFLMKIVSNTLSIDLPYSQERIDEGFKPEFASVFDSLDLNQPN